MKNFLLRLHHGSWPSPPSLHITQRVELFLAELDADGEAAVLKRFRFLK